MPTEVEVGSDKTAIRPFHVNVPEAELTDLRRRIEATRWPDRETVGDASQGVQLATTQALARYWATDYDWRKVEKKLNALPQFITEIDGLEIHFIHVRSKHDNALPLIVTHGWPGSIIEQMKIIDPLTNPTPATEEATKALRAADAHIRRRLRAIIIRQRKRPRFLFRHLRSRGASIKAAAGAAFSGRGRWFCSNHPGLTRAYPPAWFSPDRDPEPVRTFGTFTADLHRLADWLRACRIKSVVMESTGVYWIPIFEILEQKGFDVQLVNARDAKHVPGRKTDVSDAEWLQRLHEHGLLRGSFQPKGEVKALRSYLRQRERLLDSAATYIQHMQKALTQMNVQLHHVVSDITGVTGMRIVRAIVAGERDAATLAAFRDSRCKEPVETIREALIGNYREEHVFALTQALELYDIHQKKVAECDKRIETVLEQLKATRPTPAKPLPAPRHKTKQSNAPNFAARDALYAVLGIDLTQIHGLGPYLALKPSIVDSGLPSFMLVHWGRDRHRGPRLPVEHLVKRQTSETADFFGLSDRGRLVPGLRADVNVIDFDRLRLHKPELVHDMPACGRRFVQRVDGYEATLAAGIPIFERGEHTGAMPGRLVRAGHNGRRVS